MTPSSPPQRVDRNWLGRPATHWLCYVATLVGFLAAMVYMRSGTAPVRPTPSGTAELAQSVGGINPNCAGWRELAALPGLGETLSKRIVAYRQAQRASRRDPNAMVFGGPEDLQAVRGIGPKRAAALSKLVVFSD